MLTIYGMSIFSTIKIEKKNEAVGGSAIAFDIRPLSEARDIRKW